MVSLDITYYMSQRRKNKRVSLKGLVKLRKFVGDKMHMKCNLP